jgi:hypothetical protein
MHLSAGAYMADLDHLLASGVCSETDTAKFFILSARSIERPRRAARRQAARRAGLGLASWPTLRG